MKYGFSCMTNFTQELVLQSENRPNKIDSRDAKIFIFKIPSEKLT